MSLEGKAMKEKVVSRVKYCDGNHIGRYHINHILDIREYEAQFPEGKVATYTANTIFENMCAQLDEEKKYYRFLYEIQNHKKNGNVLSKDDGFIETRSGRRFKMTTAGGEARSALERRVYRLV